MSDNGDTITIANVHLPDYTSEVDRDKYEAMKEAMWDVLPAEAPGMTQDEIRRAVLPRLPEHLYPGGDRVEWWIRTVQLDHEAKGNLVREDTAPYRLHRAA